MVCKLLLQYKIMLLHFVKDIPLLDARIWEFEKIAIAH
jgi:hypothetical protein